MDQNQYLLIVTIVVLFAVIFGLLLVPILKSRRPKDDHLRNLQSVEANVETSLEVKDTQDTGEEKPANLGNDEVADKLDPVLQNLRKQETTSEPELQFDLRKSLAATESRFWGRLSSLFSSGSTDHLDIDQIEEILYTADLGTQTVETLLEQIRKNSHAIRSAEDLKSTLRTEFKRIFSDLGMLEPEGANPIQFLNLNQKTSVILIVGVNGAGKTTSIGKLSSRLAEQGKKVLVAAGDTFRAAAGNQLKTWTERAQVEIFHPEGVKDPSAVAFDAVAKAVSQDFDVVIIDTAGRLHTQSNLMEELKKMKRVVQKALPSAPSETLIVLDANSGQNALVQAKEFNQALDLTGVILTKMDGTAKGGVAVSLAVDLKLPVRMIGVGEKVSDLRPFSPTQFIEAIL